MGLLFDPSNIQAIGIGLSAFLAFVVAIYLFMSVRHDNLGRALLYIFASASIWAGFGFFYHIVSDIDIARQMRVISVAGIVLLGLAGVHFAYLFLEEREPAGRVLRGIKDACIYTATASLTFLFTDLFGGRLIVGDLLQPSHIALAPHAGPLMILIIGLYAFSCAFMSYLLARRARTATDTSDRRRALILFVSMSVGAFLGGTRFTPWYGFDFYPLMGSLGYPLYVFAAIYAIKQYKLLNMEVAVAQIIIFILWSFTFFRVLLNPTLASAIPDIGLFIAVIVLGIFLLRTIVNEMRTQEALAKLVLEKGKANFVTTAAHQLRTPLSALRWSFNLLSTNNENFNGDQHKIVEAGNSAVENMVRLVNDLLNVAHMQDGSFHYTFEKASVGDLVDASVHLLEPEAKRKKIALSVDIDKTAPACTIDPAKLNLAIQNIIDNAVKYTPESGSVSVRLTSTDEAIVLTVKDSGIGFTKDERTRLFERFSRGERARLMHTDGSGLGLSIAKTVIDGHGGSIVIDSEEDKGSLVTVTLPRCGPATTPAI